MENEVVKDEELKTAEEAAEKLEESSQSQQESEGQESTDQNLAAQLDEFKSKYYYIAAEMENSRKRFEREKDNLVKYGNERVLSGLLEVVDNLERTLSATQGDEDEKVKNIAIGIDMVLKQFNDVLAQNGLTRVESLGKSFDPNFHEAMSSEKVDGVKSGEVVRVFQEGWVLNGRLLRAAKVIVSE